MRRLPYELSIIAGISDKCNLSCIYCPQNSIVYGLEVERNSISDFSNFISFEDFKKCIDNIDIFLNEINFAGFGEPMLNPEFSDIFRYVTCEKIVSDYVYVYTNGTMLDKGLCDRIIDMLAARNVTNRIVFVFSVGSSNREDYIKLKQNDMFDKVVHNIRYFFEKTRDSKLSSSVFASVQMVGVEENIDKAYLFVEFWKNFFLENDIPFCMENYAGQFLSEKISAGIDIIEALVPDQHKSRNIYSTILEKIDIEDKSNEKTIIYKDHYEKINNIGRKPCSALWKQPFLNSSGHLLMCCRDVDGKGFYGDLKNNLFSGIYYGDKAESIRKNHLAGNFSHPDICLDCSGFEMKTLNDIELKEHLRITGNDLYYNIYLRKTGERYILDIDTVIFDDTSLDITQGSIFHLPLYIGVSNAEKDYLLEFPEFSEKFEKIDNTLLPCRYWFDIIKVRNSGVFHGCRCVDICPEDVYDNLDDIFTGNYSSLPLKCRECIYREKPTLNNFLRFKKFVSTYWSDLLYIPEFLSRNTPDLNNIMFDDIIRTKASSFRSVIISTIKKYADNCDIMMEISSIYSNCQDPYINMLCARNFLYLEAPDNALSHLEKVLFSNKNFYFDSALNLLQAIILGKLIEACEFSDSTQYEKEFELKGSLRYCAWKKGLII